MSKKSVLVVASLAYDGIETPKNKVDYVLGGAGTYICLSLKNFSSGSLLESMELMNNIWDDYANGKLLFEDDQEFFDAYEYETNAYNKVFESMKPLFV